MAWFWSQIYKRKFNIVDIQHKFRFPPENGKKAFNEIRVYYEDSDGSINYTKTYDDQEWIKPSIKAYMAERKSKGLPCKYTDQSEYFERSIPFKRFTGK